MRERRPDQQGTYLADDTVARQNAQRLEEQQGLRRATGKSVASHDRVDEPEHAASLGAEEQMSEGLQDHPFLDKQQYDGIDSNVNPAPPLADAEARREYDNAQNEKQHRKQLQMGMQPGMNSAPKPHGP
jgi:hypothetical protein